MTKKSNPLAMNRFSCKVYIYYPLVIDFLFFLMVKRAGMSNSLKFSGLGRPLPIQADTTPKVGKKLREEDDLERKLCFAT